MTGAEMQTYGYLFLAGVLFTGLAAPFIGLGIVALWGEIKEYLVRSARLRKAKGE